MKPLYSCSALSLAYPYFCCISPKSFSVFPSTWARSSSVSLPHFTLASPLISFHFPFRMSSFMFVSFPMGPRACRRPSQTPTTVLPSASLRYRYLSETHVAVCLILGSVFVLWLYRVGEAVIVERMAGRGAVPDPQGSVRASVSQSDNWRLSMPTRNQCTRCFEDPCVNASGTTVPCERFCIVSSPICEAAFRPSSMSPSSSQPLACWDWRAQMPA